MALKFQVDDIETVDEAHRSLYKEVDGKFQLDVEGASSKAKIDSFRNNNIELQKELDTIKTQINGLDLDRFKPMFEHYQTQIQKAEDEKTKELIKNGNIDELVALRSERMKQEFETQLSQSVQQSNKFRKQLEEAKINAELTRAATAKGVRSTAIDDVLLRGKQTFSLNDEGEVVAMKGDQVVYNKDNKPLTIDEYIGDLSETAPHLFESSGGGGAKNGSKTPGSTHNEGFVYRGTKHNYSS